MAQKVFSGGMAAPVAAAPAGAASPSSAGGAEGVDGSHHGLDGYGPLVGGRLLSRLFQGGLTAATNLQRTKR